MTSQWVFTVMLFPHCDITMGVYCDVIPSFSHDTFDEWRSHLEYFTYCDEATNTLLYYKHDKEMIIVFQIKINTFNGNIFNKISQDKNQTQ